MKKLFLTLLIISCLFPFANVKAQNESEVGFKAKIKEMTNIDIIVEDKDENTYTIPIDDTNGTRYQLHVGDKVLVNKIEMVDGQQQYLIVDIVRTGAIYFIISFFVLLVLILYRKKGMRALLGLLFSLLVIIFIIAPLILHGKNALVVAIGGIAVMLLPMMVITHGWNKKTWVSFLGIGISVLSGGILSYLFVSWSSLSGFTGDEATFIISLGYTDVNMRGLLLAAILIGMVGILDDVAMNQASLVKELHDSNKNLSENQIYKRAMRVGRDHINSMINTLVFAYIGAAFPLFLMFVIKQPPFDTLSGVLNNEIVATEIVRTLVGSIALLLSVPITTYLAVKIIKSGHKA